MVNITTTIGVNKINHKLIDQLNINKNDIINAIKPLIILFKLNKLFDIDVVYSNIIINCFFWFSITVFNNNF